jgi:hypothetical protein
MTKRAVVAAGALLIVFSSGGLAQTNTHHCCEGYVFYGRRTTTPGTNALGGGGTLLVFKGLGLSGDVGKTLGNPDDQITMVTGDLSYHLSCCRPSQKFEPFAGLGLGLLFGQINTHGIAYPGAGGDDRGGLSLGGGLVIWPTRRVGARFEFKHISTYCNYGPICNDLPGNGVVESRIAITFR